MTMASSIQDQPVTRFSRGPSWSSLADEVLVPTYVRPDTTFVSGDGSWLVDADGRRFLDMDGALKPHYEEGFQLYTCSLDDDGAPLFV